MADRVLNGIHGLLLMLAFLSAGIPCLAQARLPETSTNPHVQHFYRLAQQYLKKDDLVSARMAVVRALGQAALRPCLRPPRADEEAMNYTNFFPEGEALRFFLWEKDSLLSYVEVRGGSVRRLWQARLEPGRGKPLDLRISLLRSPFFATDGLTGECGRRPTLEKAVAYFEVEPSVGWLSYGRITPEGRKVELGSSPTDWLHQIRPIPGEKTAGPGQ